MANSTCEGSYCETLSGENCHTSCCTDRGATKTISDDITEVSTKENVTVSPLILELKKKWKTLHAEKGVHSKFEVTRKGGLQINPEDVQGYRKLYDYLQQADITLTQ